MLQEMDVAPLVGAWIEIVWRGSINLLTYVAPLVGAWIEINDFHGRSSFSAKSLLL